MACDTSKLKIINENTKAIVVGTGASGRAAIRLLHHIKAKVRVLDKNPDSIPEDFRHYLEEEKIELIGGEHKAEHFLDTDIIVPSPGAPINLLLPLLPHTNAPDIIAETELATRFLDDEPIIAITGTSGKTTTTSLCSAILKEHGFSVFTGGNIGTPLCEYILDKMNGKPKVDIVLLELSSFQLQGCHTLKPKVAMLLNLSENHLDHHADMQEYRDAKMHIFSSQEKDDIAIFGENVQELASLYRVDARKVSFNAEETRFVNANLFGKHNILNAEAAYAAAKEFGVSLATAQKAFEKFIPIEHRLEKVKEHNSILFVNDSKGTTVDSLKVALNSFDRPILLLAGGKFKGGDLEGLVPLVKEKVKAVVLFGASREYFEKAWKDIVPLSYKETLEEAIKELYASAQKNDVILLSPATSSFDQYPNYCERGKDFKAIVHRLIQE